MNVAKQLITAFENNKPITIHCMSWAEFVDMLNALASTDERIKEEKQC